MTDKLLGHPIVYNNPHFDMLSEDRKREIAAHYVRYEIPTEQDEPYQMFNYLEFRLSVMLTDKASFYCDMCFQEGDHEDDEETCSCDCAYGSFTKVGIAINICRDEIKRLIEEDDPQIRRPK